MSDKVHRCHRGHVKERRCYGWYCVQCEAINRHAREDKEREQGKRAPRGTKPGCKSKAVVTTQLCKRGHYRVILPGGCKACLECNKRYKRARRAFLQNTACAHADEPDFSSALTHEGVMVCLQCVAESIDAA